MALPIVYGLAASTYVWSTRLALAEKGVAHQLVEVGFGEFVQEPHVARHPFGKVPAFEHEGFALYETDAITRYVNEAFPGPDLEPSDVRERARMTQAIGVIGGYAYPCLITQIFVQRAIMPMLGNASDEAAISQALPQAKTCLEALEKLIDGSPFLAGEKLSRADLLLIPIHDYFSQTPEGQRLLGNAPNLKRWWEGVRSRPSVEKTRPSLG